MPDRILNYIFGFILILIYVLKSTSEEQSRIATAFLLALTISLLAFLMNWLSLDGIFASTIVGTVAFGLGGLSAAIALILFFLSSYFISFILGSSQENKNSVKDRRSGEQVWANAFWFALFITLAFYFRDDIMRIAAIGSLAVAMADTWATEMGTRTKNVNTYFILTFKRVEAGIDGGISLLGTFGGIMGGFLLAITYVLISGYHSIIVFLIIGIAGFLGCILDSYLGAVYQTKNRNFRLLSFISQPSRLGNNGVNALATGFGAFITIFMIWIT